MYQTIKKGSKVAVVCCSNGQRQSDKAKIEHLKNTLLKLGLVPVFGDYIFEKDSVFGGREKKEPKALCSSTWTKKFRQFLIFQGEI